MAIRLEGDELDLIKAAEESEKIFSELHPTDKTLQEGWTDVHTLPSGYDMHQEGWMHNLTKVVKLGGTCTTGCDDDDKKNIKTKTQ